MDSKVIADNFIDDFDSLRNYCDSLPYDGEVNPVDNVFYPGVNIEVPESIKDEIIRKLEKGFDCRIISKAIFFRLSVKDTKAPHQAHTDITMGEYSLMLYLNKLEDCEGGTSFVRHRTTGLMDNPINQKQLNVWENEHSNPGAWDIWDMCQMRPNRACVFPANLMHRSEPVGGFGIDATDGRLVLVCFFDLEAQ